MREVTSHQPATLHGAVLPASSRQRSFYVGTLSVVGRWMVSSTWPSTPCTAGAYLCAVYGFVRWARGAGKLPADAVPALGRRPPYPSLAL